MSKNSGHTVITATQDNITMEHSDDKPDSVHYGDGKMCFEILRMADSFGCGIRFHRRNDIGDIKFYEIRAVPYERGQRVDPQFQDIQEDELQSLAEGLWDMGFRPSKFKRIEDFGALIDKLAEEKAKEMSK